MGKQVEVQHRIRELAKVKASTDRLEGLLCRSEAEMRGSLGVKALERFAEELGGYFRTLLGEISGCGRALQAAMDRGDPLRKHAQQIVVHAEAGGSLAGGLLAFSEGGKVHPILVNITHYVQELLHLVSAILKRGIRLKTLLTERDVPVMVDPARMGQVLLTLVSHGSELVADGGVITIRTDVLPVENGLISGTRCGGCALLSISSSSVAPRPAGLVPAGRKQDPGPLPGFSIIRRIIEEHRGALRIGSQRGKPVEYSIYLPVMRGG